MMINSWRHHVAIKVPNQNQTHRLFYLEQTYLRMKQSSLWVRNGERATAFLNLQTTKCHQLCEVLSSYAISGQKPRAFPESWQTSLPIKCAQIHISEMEQWKCQNALPWRLQRFHFGSFEHSCGPEGNICRCCCGDIFAKWQMTSDVKVICVSMVSKILRHTVRPGFVGSWHATSNIQWKTWLKVPILGTRRNWRSEMVRDGQRASTDDTGCTGLDVQVCICDPDGHWQSVSEKPTKEPNREKSPNIGSNTTDELQ